MDMLKKEVERRLTRDNAGHIVVSYFEDNVRVYYLTYKSLEDYENAVSYEKQWIEKQKEKTPIPDIFKQEFE